MSRSNPRPNPRPSSRYPAILRGIIVLASPLPDKPPHFEPLAIRLADPELLKLAIADAGNMPFPRSARALLPSPDRKELLTPTTRPATRPASRASTTLPAPPGSPRALAFERRLNDFLTKEGAALLVNVSSRGDGGTLFIANASGPTPPPRGGGAAPHPAGRPPPAQPPHAPRGSPHPRPAPP